MAILSIWELIRPLVANSPTELRDLSQILNQLIQVHHNIAKEFIVGRIAPVSDVRDAVSAAVRSQSPVDVNLKLFDILGRIAMSGLWFHWLSSAKTGEVESTALAQVAFYCDIGLSLIENNSTLRLPIADEQATDIALFLQLWLVSGVDARRLLTWLENA